MILNGIHIAAHVDASVTKGLRNACRKKNCLYKKFLQNRTDAAEMKYKAYKNKLTSILRNCEKNYYINLLEQEKNNVKGTWKILNTIIRKGKRSSNYPDSFTHNGATVKNKKDIANGFNDFFVKVGPNLAKCIKKPEGSSDIADYLGSYNRNTMFLNGVEEREITEIVKNCKNKKSTGNDNIDMSIIKHVISHIVKPLTHICNISFRNGAFPDQMKVAKVIPIFKGNDKQIFTNYRPISLLPQFSKILEKLFNVRLDNFIERHSILSNSQYGFRPNMSTSLALLELTEEITSALDKKKSTIGVFIDLKKAFDTIDHTLLLEKLRHYGVRGVANDWLSSYLENRLQYVSFGDTDSTLRNVICGVPQGSILGPKLFILYINDICNVSPVLKFILFADDTNIFCSGSDIVQLSIIVSNELVKLSEWFAVNKLSLNLSKTNFMLFTNCRREQNVNIRINNCEIDMVYKTKFLGVVIDSNLNWKDHVAMVKSKLSKSIAIIHKAKHLLDRRSGMILYFSLFLPYLSYCCEVWGNTYSSNIKNVYILQKKLYESCVMLITSTPPMYFL